MPGSGRVGACTGGQGQLRQRTSRRWHRGHPDPQPHGVHEGAGRRDRGHRRHPAECGGDPGGSYEPYSVCMHSPVCLHSVYSWTAATACTLRAVQLAIRRLKNSHNLVRMAHSLLRRAELLWATKRYVGGARRLSTGRIYASARSSTLTLAPVYHPCSPFHTPPAGTRR